MRSVCLRSESAPAPAGSGAALKRLTGHLCARMRELEEIGLTVGGELSEGLVTIRFFGRDNAGAAVWLEEKRRIRTGYDAGTDMILMQVTDAVTFEDLDYVQGAVMELLT